IKGAKQHAKLSLLSWSQHVRIIVASANLTESGYRTNYEVATAIDLTREKANHDHVSKAIGFLRKLIELVPGSANRPAEILRAQAFLDHVESQIREWKPRNRRATVHQDFVFTLPADGTGEREHSSLDEAIGVCRRFGGSPREAWIASPFFDLDDERSLATAS